MRLLVGFVVLVSIAAGLVLPAAADAPRGKLRLVRLSDAGPGFLTYDGDAGFDPRRRDWPVSLIFAGRANVATVKAGLRRVGFERRGEPRWLGYRARGEGVRFDGDRGLKTRCDAHGTDVHVRVYAPAEVDHFADPQFGSFVIATAHLDRADGCGTPPKLFGFSEVAEARVARAVRRLGWTVRADLLPLGNSEPYRRDVSDSAHVWLSDGRATLVTLP